MEPIILSTANSEYFARLIAKLIPSSTLIPTTRKQFGNSERYFRIGIEDHDQLLGRNIIIVGSGSQNTDDDFNEICRVGSAAAAYGARQVFYFIPNFPYATMERAVRPGEIVTAKVIARMLSGLPQGVHANRFFFFDLHSPGIIHYFEGPACLRHELNGEEILSAAFERLGLQNFMFASVDLGRPRLIEFFAKRYRTDMAFISKKREFEKTEIEAVIGDVRGQTVIMGDDMARSSGTLIDGADAYIKRGAVAVYALMSHFGFNNAAAIQRIIDSPIVKVIGTNSHPMSQHPLVQGSEKFIVDDVSHLFARAVMKLNGGSR
jgi:ribose-phosphate pyrophosphokinase